MSDEKNINRRQFLKRTGVTFGAFGFPYIVPSSVFGRSGIIPPSEKITIGCIGVGGMGTGNMRSFLDLSDARIVAVCDLDKNNLMNAKKIVDEYYNNSDCDTYHDFRELVARKDIDVISMATPDHWHSITAIAAAKSGKDIYGEKPISHSLHEGRAMCDAVKRYNRIWQTGSWQRSQENFRFACELVLNGRIGKVSHVEVGLPSGYSYSGTKEMEMVTDPPPELDYNFWLGPAPYHAYQRCRVHWNWRWNLEYGGGQLMDWVGHHVDIAHWGLGLDYDGPVVVDGTGDFLKDGLWNSAYKYRVNTEYRNGIKMTIAGGHDDIKHGTKWIGEHGWVWVDRGFLDANPKSLLRERFDPDEIHLLHSKGHHRNFLDCVKTRETTLAPSEIAHRSASPGHLGQISMLLGRKIQFDPDTEEIIGDPTASRMLGYAFRSPWYL
ncbi:Gfo/Idh/MocA family protein [candidate division KSB1 bacterium]